MSRILLIPLSISLAVTPLHAQWTNRYPLVDGYAHHIYVEGYELPTMNAGPTAPAVSPDGDRVAFSARGWIWILDLETGRARRVTDGPHMDFRPTWSPDGSSLAFVRDDSRDTWIVVRDLETGVERTVDTDAIELDPVLGPGGELIYSSAAEGTIDLWSEGEEPLFARPGIELAPSLSGDGSVLVYMHKLVDSLYLDRIVARDRRTGEERVLATERILSQTRPEVSPDGKLVVYGWPAHDTWELRVVAVADPTNPLRLTAGMRGLPLSPTWGPEGEWIWYTEAGPDEVMRLYRIALAGGEPEHVPIRVWDWGEPVGTVRVTTRSRSTGAGEPPSGPVPARVHAVDSSGHPVVPTSGHAQFGLQDGRVFFYSPGIIDVIVPAGEVTVSAVQGLATPETAQTTEVRPNEVSEVTLELQPVWDAREAGYLSGEHHFHLNYGGPYSLDPEDLIPMMAGEDLDVGTPLLANLHNRFGDQRFWDWEHVDDLPLIRFGQEVRSHFLGHVSLLGAETLFWPWIWGPGYQVHGEDDRPNADALRHGREQGGSSGYVHPIWDRDPFAPGNHANWPIMLAVDGILGTMDWLEVACLWTNELGSSEAWYRFLNLGVPILPEAGTDVMNDFYRTMPLGTTRLYVHTGGAGSFDAYWGAFREGRSFVTTGPMVQFTVDETSHGGTVAGGRTAPFRLHLASSVAVDSVEVLVNGRIVWSAGGLAETGARDYAGQLDLPEAGWVAARVHGGSPTWPVTNPLVFAHTSPIWIDHVGSVDPEAARRSAEELRPVLDAAEMQLRAGYGEMPTPRIDAAFRAARARLLEALQGG